MGSGEGRAALVREARRLGRSPAGRKAPFTLALVTDPERTPDPAAIAAGLPPGAAVIFRGFGRADALAAAHRLADVARRRRLVLLIGADEDLAAAVGAQGLHLPERMAGRLPRLRARHPRWMFTTAAHSARALLAADRLGADAVLLSSAFESRSPSAHTVWGPVRFAQLTGLVTLPVLALGGVNGGNARRAVGAGAAGLAAVDGWSD